MSAQVMIHDEGLGFSILEGDAALELYAQVREQFERALAFSWDSMSSQEILARVLLNEVLLLVCFDGTEILSSFTFERVEDRDGIATLHCMTFAGDRMDEWIDQFLDVWIQLAKEQRCSRISIKGRKGWERFASRKGFKHQYTIMNREI